jgi:hypothetical protein
VSSVILGLSPQLPLKRTNGVLFVVRPVCAGKLFSNGHPLTVFCSHKSRTVADCLLDIRDTGEVGGKFAYRPAACGDIYRSPLLKCTSEIS